tara:strand:- start:829 stop:1011 length:183 start_codon:yes stop_codon:yes gene_type:complete
LFNFIGFDAVVDPVSSAIIFEGLSTRGAFVKIITKKRKHHPTIKRFTKQQDCPSRFFLFE